MISILPLILNSSSLFFQAFGDYSKRTNPIWYYLLFFIFSSLARSIFCLSFRFLLFSFVGLPNIFDNFFFFSFIYTRSGFPTEIIIIIIISSSISISCSNSSSRRFDFWGSLRRDEFARHGCRTR